MKNREDHAILSLELHLFFARIMKEHSLFLEAGFTPKNADFAKKAEFYKNEFENLLLVAVRVGNGIISQKTLCSGEIVTEFTSRAERQTQEFTGISINNMITQMESKMTCGENPFISTEHFRRIGELNRTAIQLLDGLIAFKQEVLDNMVSCRMFTVNYPLLIEHIMREAKLYRMYLENLESECGFNVQTMREIEQFWNRIMMEHAMFISGLLDPSENTLINTSTGFINDYAALLEKSREANNRAMSLEKTLAFRDFKAAGAKGIQNCEIRSIILPLLATMFSARQITIFAC